MHSTLGFLLKRLVGKKNKGLPEGRKPEPTTASIQHLAIIMDGNGRWAKKRGLPRTAGHTEGLKRAREITEAVAELGIPYLTLFAFSTENWNRPAEEVGFLMDLFKRVLYDDVMDLQKNNVRLKFIGFRRNLQPELLKLMEEAEEFTAGNTTLQLNIALNYGSRGELVAAARSIAELAQKGKLAPEDLTEATFAEHLLTAGIPDPDLLIRPSGELRISNFLLWQCAYTEFYFTPVLWPDFDRAELFKALHDYTRRDRRFGRVKGGPA
ncbi:MAG TPA: isoprenyl transferase [Bacillota bacterium]|nr:isoprenyl transferase [Bacillota bacterium]HPT67942.1 isoprenyl transferase [Bacillota bacterium]